MRSERLLTCRARVSEFCLNGHPVADFYDPPMYELEDGTYDPNTLSVVCNTCYVDLMPMTPSGQALLHELDAAIAGFRVGRRASASDQREPGWFPGQPIWRSVKQIAHSLRARLG